MWQSKQPEKRNKITNYELSKENFVKRIIYYSYQIFLFTCIHVNLPAGVCFIRSIVGNRRYDLWNFKFWAFVSRVFPFWHVFELNFFITSKMILHPILCPMNVIFAFDGKHSSIKAILWRIWPSKLYRFLFPAITVHTLLLVNELSKLIVQKFILTIHGKYLYTFQWKDTR